jgi:hypothetical protein
MSAPQSRNIPSQEGPRDIELSAEEVKSLLRPRLTLAERRAAREAAAVAAKSPSKRASAWQIGAVACAAAVAAIAGVVYLYKFSAAPVPPPAVVVPVEIDPVTPSVQKLAAVGPVIRIKNPFDKREVFEFPPGTSKAEAQDAVARLLLERAIDRGALYTSNTARRRKSG